MALTVNVPFNEQNRTGLCGAACAQMILGSLNPATPATVVEQDRLWDRIKALTMVPGNVVLGSAADDDSPCGPFAAKICESCRPQSFCWCTFPLALKAVILEGAPASRVRVITSATESAISAKVRACLRRGNAPAVLVSGATHWVVIDGYDEASTEPYSMLNPAFDAQITVSQDDWETWYLDAGRCGMYKTKYVVVGRDESR